MEKSSASDSRLPSIFDIELEFGFSANELPVQGGPDSEEGPV